MRNKDLATAQARFEKLRRYLFSRQPYFESAIVPQYQLLSDAAKVSFIEQVWPKRLTVDGSEESFRLMPVMAYNCVKDYIEKNEPEGVWQNISDIVYGYSAYDLAKFIYPINAIKSDYVQRAKLIDAYLDRKLERPLADRAKYLEMEKDCERLTAEQRESLYKFYDIVAHNKVLVGRLTELKRRNKEDMQIILKSRAGIQDDQADDKDTEKL